MTTIWKNLKSGMNTTTNDPAGFFRFSSLQQEKALLHFVSTRHGGVSAGRYASLNLSLFSGDDPVLVRKNREILCNTLGITVDKLFVPFQEHGDRIAAIDPAFLSLPTDRQAGRLHGVDAIVTDVPGVCVAVTTADCVPVLLYAPDRQVVAVVHAGWRGTVKRVAGETVDTLVRRYGCDPGKFLAGIGPSISVAAFEVGEEVVEAFADAGMDVDALRIFNRQTGRPHIDLWKANRLQLVQAGVPGANIETAGICTFTRPDDYFSARRSGIHSGRFLSGIMLKE